MMETTIVLKPLAEWPERKPLEQLIAEMDNALRLPGVTNGWTMPIGVASTCSPPASTRRWA